MMKIFKSIGFALVVMVTASCDENFFMQEVAYDAPENTKVGEFEDIYIYKTPYKEGDEGVSLSKQVKDSSDEKPLFSLETSLRCVVDRKNKQVITTIPYRYEAFDLYQLNVGDALPRFEVTGYSFQNKAADQVLKELLSEADIKVVALDDYYPEISADKIKGSLKNIIASIAEASDIYYAYSAKRKILYIKKNDTLAFKVPNKELLLPVLDSLRGAGIQDIVTNWSDNTLVFTADKTMERRARKLIELFDKEPQIVLYGVTVFHVEPLNANKGIDWTVIIRAFGTNNILAGDNGTVGKVLSTSYLVNQNTLVDLLSPQAKVFQIAQGEFSVPNKWRSRFDIWNCGNVNLNKSRLAMLATTEVKDKTVYSKLGIDTRNGEVSSFSAKTRLDENIVLFDIKSKYLGYAENGETIMLLTPKIIDVIKEK